MTLWLTISTILSVLVFFGACASFVAFWGRMTALDQRLGAVDVAINSHAALIGGLQTTNEGTRDYARGLCARTEERIASELGAQIKSLRGQLAIEKRWSRKDQQEQTELPEPLPVTAPDNGGLTSQTPITRRKFGQAPLAYKLKP